MENLRNLPSTSEEIAFIEVTLWQRSVQEPLKCSCVVCCCLLQPHAQDGDEQSRGAFVAMTHVSSDRKIEVWLLTWTKAPGTELFLQSYSNLVARSSVSPTVVGGGEGSGPGSQWIAKIMLYPISKQNKSRFRNICCQIMFDIQGIWHDGGCKWQYAGNLQWGEEFDTHKACRSLSF